MREHATFELREGAPETLWCEVEIWTPEAHQRHLMVQAEPEVKLLRVIFTDGSCAESSRELSELVKEHFRDPQGLRHDSWRDLQDRCREMHREEDHRFASAVGLFMDAQRRAGNL